MIKAGIIGASGYTGEILAGLLLRHPKVSLEWITSESNSGEKLSNLYPHLSGECDMVLQKANIDKLAGTVDVAFIALPNGMAMNIVPKLLKAKTKVVDLSADYRFKSSKVFSEWYKIEHTSQALLEKAAYGLPELVNIKGASLVANPGCYATASILGAMPLVAEGLIDLDSMIIDAKSGVSGAGKTLTDDTHFPNCNDGISAYKVAIHRHTPEIEQLLGHNIKLTFTPHLVPMTRGILSVIYSHAKKTIEIDKLVKLYKSFYKGKKFVRILENKLPSTKYVYGSNFCDIAVKLDKRTGNIIVLSAIDNLMKGASGQAVQNMNLMFGLNEALGLDIVPIFP